MSTFHSSLSRYLLAAALSAGLLASPARLHAQGMNAKATVAAPANAEIARLQRQLAALEKRIVELEKDEVEAPEDPDEAAREQAHDKALERRLAALESSASDSKARNDAAKSDNDNDSDGEDSITVRAPFVVHDKAGHTIFRVDTVDDGRPLVVIGNPLSNTAAIGIDPLGNASLRLFDSKRQAAVSLSAKSDGGDLLLSNKANKPSVALSADANGAGRMKVYGAGGRAVAALATDEHGGRVLVVDGKSGFSTATLSTTPEGGMVNVYAPEGGSPRASLIADGKTGSVNVLNGSGIGVGVIESGDGGSGRLMLTNAGGDIVVEGGVLPKGIGIIRTGPGGDGPAGVLGGGLRPASSIQGRK